jgi:hypothetical protein
MKKISLEQIRAARESLVKLSLVRQIGVRNGQSGGLAGMTSGARPVAGGGPGSKSVLAKAVQKSWQ